MRYVKDNARVPAQLGAADPNAPVTSKLVIVAVVGLAALLWLATAVDPAPHYIPRSKRRR